MRHRVAAVDAFGVNCGVRIEGLYRGIPTGRVCPPISFWSLPPLIVDSHAVTWDLLRPSVSLWRPVGQGIQCGGECGPPVC